MMEAKTGVSSSPCRWWQLLYLVQPLPKVALTQNLQLRSEDSHSLMMEAKTGVSSSRCRWWHLLYLVQPLPKATLTPSLQVQREVSHSKMSMVLSIQG